MPKPKKLTRTLANKGLIHPPPWLPDNIMLEGLTGSFAYGCEDPKKADRDIVGIVIPPKTVIFPHLAGYIQGFGTQPPKFDQFQAHGIEAIETEYFSGYACIGASDFLSFEQILID